MAEGHFYRLGPSCQRRLPRCEGRHAAPSRSSCAAFAVCMPRHTEGLAVPQRAGQWHHRGGRAQPCHSPEGENRAQCQQEDAPRPDSFTKPRGTVIAGRRGCVAAALPRRLRAVGSLNFRPTGDLRRCCQGRQRATAKTLAVCHVQVRKRSPESIVLLCSKTVINKEALKNQDPFGKDLLMATINFRQRILAPKIKFKGLQTLGNSR